MALLGEGELSSWGPVDESGWPRNLPHARGRSSYCTAWCSHFTHWTKWAEATTGSQLRNWHQFLPFLVSATTHKKNAKTPFRLAIASPVFPVQLRAIVGKEKAPELHLAILLSGLLIVAWNTDNKRIGKQHWWKSVLSTSKMLLNIAALGCFIWTAKLNHCSCLDFIITDQRSKPQGRTHRTNVALSREGILISVTI